MKTLIILCLAALAALAQNVPPGGGKPTLVSVDGSTYSAAPKIYIAPGTGVTNSLSCANGVCTVTLNSSGGAGVSSGTSLPATCTVGTPFVLTNATPNTAQLYACTATDTWTQQTGGSGDVTGGTSLTTAGAIPYVSASGTLNQLSSLYKHASTASIGIGPGNTAPTGTLHIQDATATTGATNVVIKAGAGQSTTKLLDIQNSSGSSLSYFDNSGILKGVNIYSETYNGSANNVFLGSYSFQNAFTFFDSNGMKIHPGQGLFWSSAAMLNSASDTGLSRNAAGVVEINNGTAGALRDLKLRNISATSSIDGAHTVNLTDATTTTMFTVAMADGAIVGGQIHYTIYATNGTDHQAHSGVATYAGVRKGATYTLTINEAATLESAALSGGTTLSDTFSFTAGTDSAVVGMNADTSLASTTTFKITYTITNNTGSTITYP